MTAEAFWAALYGRVESAGRVETGSSAGGGQDLGIEVESEEDRDLSAFQLSRILASAQAYGGTSMRYANAVESPASRYLRTPIRFSAWNCVVSTISRKEREL